MSFRYTDDTQTAVMDGSTGMAIPLIAGNRHYENKVKPWFDQGNTPAPATPAATPVPATLPVIAGATTEEKLQSVIEALQSKGIATGE